MISCFSSMAWDLKKACHPCLTLGRTWRDGARRVFKFGRRVCQLTVCTFLVSFVPSGSNSSYCDYRSNRPLSVPCDKPADTFKSQPITATQPTLLCGFLPSTRRRYYRTSSFLLPPSFLPPFLRRSPSFSSHHPQHDDGPRTFRITSNNRLRRPEVKSAFE